MTPEFPLDVISSDVAPYQFSAMEELGNLDTPSSYDTSSICASGDDFGQGLFDFDLAWTFDFLNDDAAQVETPEE
jgi:hypothetical protein